MKQRRQFRTRMQRMRQTAFARRQSELKSVI